MFDSLGIKMWECCGKYRHNFQMTCKYCKRTRKYNLGELSMLNNIEKNTLRLITSNKSLLERLTYLAELEDRINQESVEDTRQAVLEDVNGNVF